MLKTEITFDTNRKYSINNNVLFDIVMKLEEILRQLKKETIEESKNKITDIIIMMSHIIDENNRNLSEINAEIRDLKKIKISFNPLKIWMQSNSRMENIKALL